MPKTPITINFKQGVNTKTDPWQLPIGQFKSLKNSVFTTEAQLQKRNGYAKIVDLPSSDYNYLTTLGDNLTAVGQNIAAYDSSTGRWVSKGNIQPVSLSVLPLIRNSLSQTQCDAAVAPNGLVCTVYTESIGTSVTYKYAVANSVTGQNIVVPTAIPVSSGTVTGSPRVFVVGTYFVIVFTNVITATSHLQFISISTSNPSTPTANTDIASSYISASTVSWDGVVFNNQLFIAYNTTSGGQAVKVTYLTIPDNIALAVSPSAVHTFSGRTATMMSMAVDTTVNNPAIYLSFYDAGGSTGYTAAVDNQLNVLLAPTQIISSGTILNITCAAKSGVCTVFYEVSNTYAYNSVATNYIDMVTITAAGTVSSVTHVIRSLGLASKAFIIDSKIYFLGAFQSTYQNTYFVVNGLSTQASPLLTAKLAYENGGGYLTLGLPSVTVTDSQVQIAYLYKDLVQPLATVNNTQQTTTGGVYSQTGVNLVLFDLSLGNIASVEIANSLQIGGGFGWLYDGNSPVESNFFLWPDALKVTTNASAVTPTGTTTNGSNVITAVSTMVGVGIGAGVTGTGIPANQLVTGFTSTTITFGPLVATGTNVATTITVTGKIATAQIYYYQAIYQWTDNQGNTVFSAPSVPVTVTTTGTTSTNTINIPNLRLTYKTNVKIILYRWSTAQQIYYQVTSVTQPTLSLTTADTTTFYDCLDDTSISGNSIIYTTGGTVEDINPPATNVMTLFDTRVWAVDAEDPNLLWFSKQVIEATPVEWSDLFTFYVAPNAGTVSSTGPITALAPMDDKLIILKENALYYINGQGPDNTGSSNGYNGPIFITSSVGCTEPSSIVLIDAGLMFQSNKGIWLLPRGISQPVYIGAAVEVYNSGLVQSAVNVPLTTQVRQTVSTGQTLMYDYFYNQWGTFEGVPAVSACAYQNLHSFVNQYGQVFQESPGAYLDGSNPVLLSFQTGWINLAGIQGFERFYYLYLLGKFLSPCQIQVQIAYDYNDSPVQSSIITPTNYSTATPSSYGDQSAPFGASPNVLQWQVHAKKQKCEAFQITLTEIYDSTVGGTPGAGFTLSGITLYTLVKGAKFPLKSANSVG